APRDDLHQPTLAQLLDHRARIHAPDLVYFYPSHGLPVGDDGQRLERRRAEPPRAQRELCAIERLRVLTPRQELPALRDLDELNPVVARRERVPQLGQGAAHGRRARLRIEGQQLLDRERPGRREQRRLNELREGTHGGSESGRTAPPGERAASHAWRARAER